MTNTNKQESLLNQTFDLTVVGIILTSLFFIVEKRMTGYSVLIVCSFLACNFLWKLLWPFNRIQKYKWWQAFAFMMIGVFSWWLIYSAENTRAGWYRLHGLAPRIQSLIREAPAYIIMADADGYITETSNNIQTLTGYTPQELKGQQTSVLMRDGPSAKHQIAFDKAVNKLRSLSEPTNGWMLQGLIVVGIKHKDGHIVPVKAYAGGIRWSMDVQFNGDTDLFAMFVPVSIEEAMGPNSTVRPHHDDVLKVSPQPPPVPTVLPIPSPVPLPNPPAKPVN